MARNANGDGSIRQRKDGSWEFRATVSIKSDGKPLQKSFYGRTKTAAKESYKKWLAKNETPIEKVTTVSEWAGVWLEAYKKGKIAHKSWLIYRTYIRDHINPEIGNLKLSQVRPAHLARLFAGKQDYSWSFRRDLRTILKGIFGTAIENRLCADDPTKGLDIGKAAKSGITAFGRDDLKKILAFAKTYPKGYYIEILLYTGLRMGEVLALKWDDVDMDAGVITVRSAVALTENGFAEKETKTGRVRHVGIKPELAETLNSLPKDTPYVIAGERAQNTYETQFRRVYNDFFAALNETLPEGEKVAVLSPHKCRHTFGTYLLAGGANIRAVQDMMGHALITTTERYTHVNAEDIRSNMLKLEY